MVLRVPLDPFQERLQIAERRPEVAPVIKEAVGQVQAIATGASVAGNMMARNPQLATEYKLLLKDSPNFIGVAKGEDALRSKVNEIILGAKKAGDLDAMAKKWLGRPAGTLPE